MIRLTSSTDSNGVEEIHSVGTINNVETSYFTQLKICYLMTREKTELIYRVPCNNCSSSYVGETGRKFGLRINEHKNEVDSFTAGTQTRASGAGRAVQLTGRQSHACRGSHVVDWDKAGVVDGEAQRQTRWMREVLWVGRMPMCVGRDAGSCRLGHAWGQVLSGSRAPSGCKQSRRDQDVRRTSKRCH